MRYNNIKKYIHNEHQKNYNIIKYNIMYNSGSDNLGGRWGTCLRMQVFIFLPIIYFYPHKSLE